MANVHDHALRINVVDLEPGQFQSAHAGGIQRHHDHAMEGAVGGVDQTSDLLGREDVRQSARSLRVGCPIQVPLSSERLDVEEPQRRHPLRHGVGGELTIAKQVRLVLADLLGT